MSTIIKNIETMKSIGMTLTMTALSLMISAAAFASNANRPDVTGTVTDQKGQPLEFVSVALLSAKDSAYVQGATSDETGKFRIITPAESGILRLSCVGYETRYVNVSNIQSGTIVLNDDAQMLSEVTVKGQLPKTKLTGNSMLTTIEGTVLGQSGTLEEMLAKVPGMTKKGDDLEVLGKGTPIYYINGRKLTDIDELKRLRSEEIQNVEVITNPGAQYDATVSCVVRIKTKRRQGDGFGYDLMANNNQDLRYGYSDPNSTINLRYRHNNLDIFGMINYWKWDSVNDSEPDQASYFLQDGNIININQTTSLRHDWHGQGFNYNLGFNWQINSDHSVGVRVERHDKFNSGIDAWISTDMERRAYGFPYPQFVECSSTLQRDEQHQPYNWDGNAYYNGKVGKLGIDLNVDFVTNKQNEQNKISEIVNGKESAPMSQEQHTSSRLWATKLVLSYPIWKGQLQAGTEMSFVKRTNDYSITGYPLPTTNSDVKENNIAGFVEYGCAVPKFGNLNAGLRYEHVGFDYTDNLNASKSMSRYTDELFPSLSWSNMFGPIQTSLAYSIKTIRPNYSMLDEGVIYINSYSLQQGNPQLKNAKMQEVSLNARWKWLNLFVAYERRDDTQSQWSYIYNDEGVILIKNINLENPVRNLAAFLTASPTFGIYTANWTAGVQKFFYEQTLADPREASKERTVSYKTPIGFFDLNNTFRLKHSWQFEVNANIYTKGDVMNYHLMSPSFNLRFVVQKCWLKNDALCLRASIDDVLQRSGQKVQMDCGYYVLNQDSRNNRHRLNVSLRYTFNASQSKYKGTGAGKDAQGRMGNDN